MRESPVSDVFETFGQNKFSENTTGKGKTADGCDGRVEDILAETVFPYIVDDVGIETIRIAGCQLRIGIIPNLIRRRSVDEVVGVVVFDVGIGIGYFAPCGTPGYDSGVGDADAGLGLRHEGHRVALGKVCGYANNIVPFAGYETLALGRGQRDGVAEVAYGVDVWIAIPVVKLDGPYAGERLVVVARERDFLDALGLNLEFDTGAGALERQFVGAARRTCDYDCRAVGEGAGDGNLLGRDAGFDEVVRKSVFVRLGIDGIEIRLVSLVAGKVSGEGHNGGRFDVGGGENAMRVAAEDVNLFSRAPNDVPARSVELGTCPWGLVSKAGDETHLVDIGFGDNLDRLLHLTGGEKKRRGCD